MASNSLGAASLIALTLHKGVSGTIFYTAAHRSNFSVATACFLTEVLKMLVSFSILAYQAHQSQKNNDNNIYIRRKPYTDIEHAEEKASLLDDEKDISSERNKLKACFLEAASKIHKQMTSGRSSFWLLFAAALYVVQNTTFLYASGKLDPPLMQAIWQLRLLATAFASKVFLHRTFSRQQVYSMALLMFAVYLIDDGLRPIKNTSQIILDTENRTSMLLRTEDLNRVAGLCAALVACMISGLAGVVVEKVLKERGTNLWASSFQMSVFSFGPAIFLMYGDVLSKKGIAGAATGFMGFDGPWPWANVAVQGIAGFLVAFVTKYTSTIAKSFSGGFSIIVALLLSIFLGTRKEPLPIGSKAITLLVGLCALLFSTLLYARGGQDKPRTQDIEQVKSLSQAKLESEISQGYVK